MDVAYDRLRGGRGKAEQNCRCNCKQSAAPDVSESECADHSLSSALSDCREQFFGRSAALPIDRICAYHSLVFLQRLKSYPPIVYHTSHGGQDNSFRTLRRECHIPPLQRLIPWRPGGIGYLVLG